MCMCVMDRIEAFLIDCRQRVVVQGFKSRRTSVIRSIPQGSFFGPVQLMSFVNVNDMPLDSGRLEVSSCITLFLDDTKIYVPARTEQRQW